MRNRVGLIVVGSFKIGGAERMAINIGEELRRNGIDIHYALQRPIFEIPNAIDPSKIHVINKTEKGNKLLFHLRSVIGVFSLRITLNPGFVIGFTYFSSFLSCFTFLPRVYGRFDNNIFLINRKLRHRIGNFVAMWPFVKAIVAPSYGIGDALKKVNSSFRKKIVVIHNSIDFEQIELLGREKGAVTGVAGNRPYLTAMGRFSRKKNYQLLLKAYAKSKISQSMDLVLIGDGHVKEQLMSLATELNLNGKVHFTGFLSNPFPIIKESKLFVNTSDSESFCNVILEALSLSIPVVASDCNFGPSEMIVHGRNGFLFEPNNEQELISILDKLDADEAGLRYLRNNATESVENFHLEKIGQHWIKLLADA